MTGRLPRRINALTTPSDTGITAGCFADNLLSNACFAYCNLSVSCFSIFGIAKLVFGLLPGSGVEQAAGLPCCDVSGKIAERHSELLATRIC